MTEQASDKVSKTALILAIVFTAIATVAAMEWQGMLKHSDNKEEYALSEYKVIFIEKQANHKYRLSQKPSNQSAKCYDGYLFISSDVNTDMQGLLVDYKNRGVKCTP